MYMKLTTSNSTIIRSVHLFFTIGRGLGVVNPSASLYPSLIDNVNVSLVLRE